MYYINQRLYSVKLKFLWQVFQPSKLDELPSHVMINAPETKWTAYSVEGNNYTKPQYW